MSKIVKCRHWKRGLICRVNFSLLIIIWQVKLSTRNPQDKLFILSTVSKLSAKRKHTRSMAKEWRTRMTVMKRQSMSSSTITNQCKITPRITEIILALSHKSNILIMMSEAMSLRWTNHPESMNQAQLMVVNQKMMPCF